VIVHLAQTLALAVQYAKGAQAGQYPAECKGAGKYVGQGGGQSILQGKHGALLCKDLVMDRTSFITTLDMGIAFRYIIKMNDFDVRYQEL
jgi:hypothetical protein